MNNHSVPECEHSPATKMKVVTSAGGEMLCCANCLAALGFRLANIVPENGPPEGWEVIPGSDKWFKNND